MSFSYGTNVLWFNKRRYVELNLNKIKESSELLFSFIYDDNIDYYSSDNFSVELVDDHDEILKDEALMSSDKHGENIMYIGGKIL